MGGRSNNAMRNSNKLVKDIPKIEVAAVRFGSPVTVNDVENYTIWRSGGIVSSYGEIAHLIKAQEKYLVFETESGVIFKTDYQLNTIGKAKKAGYFFSLQDDTKEKNFIKSPVSF